jgi:hypothetical protein
MNRYVEAVTTGRITRWKADEYFNVTDSNDGMTYSSKTSYKDAASEWAWMRDIDLNEKVQS